VDSVATAGPGASGVGVVDRSVAVLDALATRGPLSLAELAAATGLTRPTAHRLARAWEQHGVLGRDALGRFRLGSKLAAWASQESSLADLVDAAGPILRRLRDETGESAQLFVREGEARVCVAVAERASGLRDTVPLGAVLPLDRGSGGQVLRAFAAGRTPAVRDAAAVSDVDAALARVRAQGWAASIAEREAGVASVSAPVFDRTGELVAAISVSGPLERLTTDPGARLAPAVVAAATALESRVVGHEV